MPSACRSRLTAASTTPWVRSSRGSRVDGLVAAAIVAINPDLHRGPSPGSTDPSVPVQVCTVSRQVGPVAGPAVSGPDGGQREQEEPGMARAGCRYRAMLVALAIMTAACSSGGDDSGDAADGSPSTGGNDAAEAGGVNEDGVDPLPPLGD